MILEEYAKTCIKRLIYSSFCAVFLDGAKSKTVDNQKLIYSLRWGSGQAIFRYRYSVALETRRVLQISAIFTDLSLCIVFAVITLGSSAGIL